MYENIIQYVNASIIATIMMRIQASSAIDVLVQKNT